MLQPQTAPAKIAVLSHPSLPASIQEAAQVADFFREQAVERVEQLSLYDDGLGARIHAADFDLVIGLGGDGTMLRCGHLVAGTDVPVLGINVGRFGFLAEVRLSEWRSLLPRLLEKSFWLEERMLLRAEHWSGEQQAGAWDVLNEVVVCRGQWVRPIRVKASVDGVALTTYVADGLIAATPTGSTAYALAAGGPIMPPELRNILIIPVAPHLSVDRAVILAEGATVEMTVFSDHDAVFSVDGQSAIPLRAGDRVRVFSGEHRVHFIRFQDPGYFYRNLTAYMDQNPSANGV